ncbi:hypothetical protein T265_05331 [Opisthorchis viverrini]|uniref:Uncharacterized protein n=1 Tax=Opisthorchis viverrini TaxID=6198 RepID=A0A075AFG4_OPIVI|nr:hypothetical protein T265_05331 [Opisthorchis viverrini]KER27704.1 hypothetical protein T265_05331 [Opisthorchis viverrini]
MPAYADFNRVRRRRYTHTLISMMITTAAVLRKEPFSYSTFARPSCHAIQRKHEGWDTARLPKSRQEKSRVRGRVRITDHPLCEKDSVLIFSLLAVGVESEENGCVKRQILHDSGEAIMVYLPCMNDHDDRLNMNQVTTYQNTRGMVCVRDRPYAQRFKLPDQMSPRCLNQQRANKTDVHTQTHMDNINSYESNRRKTSKFPLHSLGALDPNTAFRNEVSFPTELETSDTSTNMGANRSAIAPFRCYATGRKHEGWDTARLPKPRQGKSRGRGWVLSTDLPVWAPWQYPSPRTTMTYTTNNILMPHRPSRGAISRVALLASYSRAAGQFDCKRFITNRGDVISALLWSVVVRSGELVVVPLRTTTLYNNALLTSPRLVMKRLQSNCPAQQTSQRSPSINKSLTHQGSTQPESVSLQSDCGGAYKDRNRAAIAPFRCLTAMPQEGSMRAGILPGCPSLDRGSGEAEVAFEPRTSWLTNSRSNHLSHLTPSKTGNNF